MCFIESEECFCSIILSRLPCSVVEIWKRLRLKHVCNTAMTCLNGLLSRAVFPLNKSNKRLHEGCRSYSVRLSFTASSAHLGSISDDSPIKMLGYIGYYTKKCNVSK